MAKICPQCNKEFHKPYNESKSAWKNRHIFCSKSCYTKSQKGFMPEYVIEANKGRRPWNKGKKIGRSINNTQIVRNCLNCNKEFQFRRYRIHTAKFCSHQCAHTARNQGKTSLHMLIRKSAKYKQWREKIFQRDNYTCQICGVKGGKLHADHIMPFALFSELRLELDNGRTLCEGCHRLTDTYGNKKIYCVATSQEA